MKIYVNRYLWTIILILGIFLFYLEANAQALLAPQIYFTDLKLSKNRFVAGEKIKGEVSFANYDEFIIVDLLLKYQILTKETYGIIEEKIDREILSIKPGEEVTRLFEYTLPSYLPMEDLVFRVRLTTTKGEDLGWIDRPINVVSEGKFLSLYNYWLLKDGKKLHPGAGFEYSPNEIPQVEFDAVNNSKFTITAFPRVTIYKRNLNAEVVKVLKYETFTFQPSVTKKIKLNLSNFNVPESYLAVLRMYDRNTGKPISNTIYFRWVVPGDSGRILWLGIDKDSYQKGEEAVFKVIYVGPPHIEALKGPIKEGELVFKLYNEKGELTGEGKKIIKLKAGEAMVKVPVNKDVISPKIVATISKGGKTFDEYSYRFSGTISRAETSETTEEMTEVTKEGVLESPITATSQTISFSTKTFGLPNLEIVTSGKAYSFFEKNRLIIGLGFLVVLLILAYLVLK